IEAATARTMWKTQVQPLIASQCASCHVGKRFAFAALTGSGGSFSEEETEENYQRFLDLLSLDSPKKSRLLAKPLPDTHPDGMQHGGGTRLQAEDAAYTTMLNWINQEKAERCPDCGLNASKQYLAYVEQPRIFWAIPASPIRSDHGLRDRSRIMLQPLTPSTLMPTGAPIDFLNNQFCGADGRCDFGHLAINHAGTQMAFECRLGTAGEDWVHDVSWNICMAEISPDGHAINPRFLMPPPLRHSGRTIARSDPIGLYNSEGNPLKGVYDKHFWIRDRNDTTPVFSPDDQWIYLSSQGLDPNTGEDGSQTYHGSDHLNNIIAVKTDGSSPRTIYRNEGGMADFPFFRRNGNLAFRTWNLERMDRFMYTQSTADGMMEMPVFLGRVQGPNMWEKATELANGGIIGITGRRRSETSQYVSFFADHTLGIGDIDPALRPFTILDETVFNQLQELTWCKEPPNGPNCVTDRFYADPNYAPDGRAFISFNPETTHVSQGELMYGKYGTGSTTDDKLSSLYQYTPARLGISLIDHRGQITTVLGPRDGYMNRFPTWVGKRTAPRIQPTVPPSQTQTWSDLHIADVPIWFSFRFHKDREKEKASHLKNILDRIVAIRVLTKVMVDNACLADNIYYIEGLNGTFKDHPTHLGIVNSTGYERFVVPQELGGDSYGDIPIKADRSIKLRVPAGQLLLFQGVDALGHVVHQRSRLLTLPPGHSIDTSVKREQYQSQCSSCHHRIDYSNTFVPLSQHNQLPFVPMDFATMAASSSPIDLTNPEVGHEEMTYKKKIRPLLDAKCVSCHSGSTPAGELSLEANYSPIANFPAGHWATEPFLAKSDYMMSIPEDKRVPGYNYSIAYSWLLKKDQNEYKQNSAYTSLINSFSPLGTLAPWDPGYQNLFARDNGGFLYLSNFLHTIFGRSDRVGGNSSGSWLVEILSGRDISPRSFSGPDHTKYLTANEQRDIMAVIDVGFPYTARCNDRMVPSGPNSGKPWGDPKVTTTANPVPDKTAPLSPTGLKVSINQ
ncbi:MAG: hypothetical protein KC643_28775, partial [Nitrospira sp.]|nr:hypothetical protein [Nitrospira sp.]